MKINDKLRRAVKDSTGIASIYTVLQFVNPYLFSKLTKQPAWIVLTEGLVFFLMLIPLLYYFYNKVGRRK